MMDALTRFFTRASMAKMLMYFKRYMNHRMKKGRSISQHIIEMNGMAIDLEFVGFKLPAEVQAMVLMESLPESWEDVVTSITMNLARDEEALMLDNVRKKLLNVGHWKEFKRRARDDEESSSRDGSRSRGGFNGKCYDCGEFGHRKSDCPN